MNYPTFLKLTLVIDLKAAERWRVPLLESLRVHKQKFESAVKLAKFLIARDKSWESTEPALEQSKIKSHKYGKPKDTENRQAATLVSPAPSSQNQGANVPESQEPRIHIPETPLILATKSGCIEIVDEILRKYPQAVEYVDDEGRNILHVAIKYRQIEILDLVEKMEVPMRRLKRKVDNNGNSILHMVGVAANLNPAQEYLHSPARVLQEDLLLFERLKVMCSTDFIKLVNSKGQTAEHLLVENTADLREKAREWLKRTAENCSIVAVLISTVAFAAAYTVPGGPDQTSGYPLLLKKSLFVVFCLGDVLSLTLALTSVITFLSILTSPYRLIDFKKSLPQKLLLGFTLLILSVSTMMLSFGATIILMLHKREKRDWTKITLYSVAFLPVTIFVATYVPLYLQFLKTITYTLSKVQKVLPQYASASAASSVKRRNFSVADHGLQRRSDFTGFSYHHHAV